MANVSDNLFAELQERVLDPLKSDLTVAELDSGHTKPAVLVDESQFSTFGSTSPPSTPSLDSDSDVLVYSHDDLVKSLAKQLQIQTRINTIYDRDLECRTQIIEELSVRITELESVSRVRVEDEQVLIQLRRRVRKLERALYVSQLVNKSLVDVVDVPEGWEGPPMPEGYNLVQSDWYESVVTGSVAWGVERENWKARVCTLEGAFATLQERENKWRNDLSTSTENGSAVASAAVREEERQKLEEAFEAERATLRTQLTEVSRSLERVAEENARVCIRRCTAKCTDSNASRSCSPGWRNKQQKPRGLKPPLLSPKRPRMPSSIPPLGIQMNLRDCKLPSSRQTPKLQSWKRGVQRSRQPQKLPVPNSRRASSAWRTRSSSSSLRRRATRIAVPMQKNCKNKSPLNDVRSRSSRTRVLRRIRRTPLGGSSWRRRFRL